MKNIRIKFALSAALLAALATAANAAPRGQGASGVTPGHMMQSQGSLAGHPGASGYSPGHQMQFSGPVRGHPGASGYAPGHLKKQHRR